MKCPVCGSTRFKENEELRACLKCGYLNKKLSFYKLPPGDSGKNLVKWAVNRKVYK